MASDQVVTSSAPNPRAADVAYQFVRARIFGMELGDSAFLTEMGIAAELGMSRTPVREALVQLAAENVLQLLPGKGAFVPPIDHREAVDVMELRELIETFAVVRLRSRDGQVVSRLAESLEEQKRYLEAEDGRSFIEADRGFHLTIVRGSGNVLMASVYERLRDRQLRMGVRALGSSVKRWDDVLAEHQRILDTIANDEVEGAAVAVRDHLRNTLVALRAQW